jgi:hypothetical protein
MANGFALNLELDRIDNNKGYSKANCRWVTRKQQLNNYSRNHVIAYKGERLPLSAWAERLQMNYSILTLPYQRKQMDASSRVHNHA